MSAWVPGQGSTIDALARSLPGRVATREGNPVLDVNAPEPLREVEVHGSVRGGFARTCAVPDLVGGGLERLGNAVRARVVRACAIYGACRPDCLSGIVVETFLGLIGQVVHRDEGVEERIRGRQRHGRA